MERTVMDDAQLQTIWQQRRGKYRVVPLAEPLGVLMKHKLARRVKQFGQLGDIWDEVLPAELREHTALESLHRGTLTVAIDSTARRFQLQKLLAGGLQKEIQSRFHGTLNRIRLVPGQFYALDAETGQKRYEFEFAD
jgi:predicted nucleic acid-binding Zn ribbon protein